jgi:copper(I)-binding protein
MVIANNTDLVDHLVSVSSEACAVAELHESTTNGGVMSMRQVGPAGIEVPPDGLVTLDVGGLHVMCVDKQAEFTVGTVFDLSLEFENAGRVVVEAEIREG